MNLYFSRNVNITNCKVISSRSNGDGISVQSCSNVIVKGCFIRSWDDSLVVKNYPDWSDPSIEGRTEGVHFSECLIYNDLAQCMEIGYETVGKTMKDITFTNIDVINAKHLAVFSIHNANNALLENVYYRNITVERANEALGVNLLEFSTAYSPIWSEVQKKTELGSIDGVFMENILIENGRKNLSLSIKGTLEERDGYDHKEHPINNVSITDFLMMGEKLTIEDKRLHLERAYKTKVLSSGKKISGATLPAIDSSSYGYNVTLVDF